MRNGFTARSVSPFVLLGLTALAGVGLAAHGPAARQREAQACAGWRQSDADFLFMSGRDGNGEVYVLRAGEKEWVNLTKHEAGDNWPVWSPDGARIAFQSNRSGNLDIWTMKADGSELRQLTNHFEPDYLPAWSPDGRTVSFTSWRKDQEVEPRAPHVYAMDPDGSNQRRIVKESLNVSAGATWSPDGARIVYERKGAKGADIYVADADGRNERRLTHDQDKDFHNAAPTFSPTGREIAFHSDDSVSAAIVVMAADGTNRRTVVSGGYNWYPRWSPDGRWLTYTATVPTGEKGNIDVFAVPVDRSRAPIPLADSPKRDQEGSWRPCVVARPSRIDGF